MASSARIDELKKKFDESPRRYFAPLANEYRKAGDPEQAIAICREFLPQQPGHMSGHIVYGQALYDAQQFDEARAVFDTALTLDPENLIALRSLGDIAQLLGDAAGARGWYQRVLDADPRNEEIAALLTSLAAAPEGAPEPPPTAEAEVQAARAARNSDGIILGATPLDEAPQDASVVAMPPEGFVAQAATTPAEPAPAEPPLESVAPPADELLDLGDLTIRTEVPVVPRISTPRASLRGMGVDIERSDDESFMPHVEPAAAPDEPPVPAAPAAAAWAEEAADEPPAVEAFDTPEISEFTLEDFGAPMAAPEARGAPAPTGAAPAPAAAEPADPFATETMADLYLAQGHADDALRVFRALLAQRPGDAALEARIAGIVAMTALTPAIPMQAVPHTPESEREPGFNFELEPAPPSGSEADAAPAPAVQELPDLDASGFGLESAVEAAVEVDAIEEISPAAAAAADVWEPAPATSPAEAVTVVGARAEGPSIREFLATLAQYGAGAPAGAPELVPAVEAEPAPAPVAAEAILDVPAPVAPAAAPAVPLAAAPRAATPVAGTITLLSPAAAPPAPVATAESGGSIDRLFGAGAVPTPDQAAAAALAGAFGVVAEEPVPPIAGAPARRATEELSLDHVFRESHAPAPPETGGFSFDRFFESNSPGPATPARETPIDAPAAGGGDADIEQFNSWLQGLKKR